MPADLMTGALAAFSVMGLFTALRFAVAYARSESLSVSWNRTTKWITGIALAFGAAVSTGLVQFGDLITGLVQYVVSHPFLVSNAGLTGLGVGALNGVVNVSTSQYIGIAVMLVGAVFLLVEADEYV